MTVSDQSFHLVFKEDEPDGDSVKELEAAAEAKRREIEDDDSDNNDDEVNEETKVVLEQGKEYDDGGEIVFL